MAEVEVVREAGEGTRLSGGVLVRSGAVATETDEALRFDDTEQSFWSVSASKGAVLLYRREQDLGGAADAEVYTRGLPTGVAVDSDGVAFVSDVELSSVLKVNEASGRCKAIVQDHEGRPLLGPSSLAFGPRDDTLYFTDSGPLGESSLEDACGSVFAITRDDDSGQMLKPLALNCLAHPCGVCVGTSPAGLDVVYVAELLRNRVLRFLRRPHGAFVCSVLHQFSGRLGPSAIAYDAESGCLYVARSELDATSGLISVLDPSGRVVLSDIELPELGTGDISALVLNQEPKELIVFAAVTGKVLRLKL